MCHLISQVGQQYDITGNSEIVIVDHYEQDRIRYSSLAKFSEYNTKTPYPIEELIIQWKFLLKTAQVGKYHEYQINVNIGSVIVNNSRLGPRDYKFFSSIVGVSSISYSIDYVDYVVARSFTQAFEEWTKTLVFRKTDPFINFYIRHDDTFRLYASSFSALIPFFMVKNLYEIFAQRSNPGLSLAIWLAASVIFSVIMFFITNMIMLTMSGRLMSLKDSCVLLINKGDQDNYDKIVSQEKRSPVRLALTFASVFLQIAIGAAGSVIASKV